MSGNIVKLAEIASIRGDGKISVVYEDGTSSGYITAINQTYEIGDFVAVCDDVILGVLKERM